MGYKIQTKSCRCLAHGKHCRIVLLWFGIALIHLVHADDTHDGEIDEHAKFDIVVGAFITFTFCMVAYHCYLKREERRKIENNLVVWQ